MINLLKIFITLVDPKSWTQLLRILHFYHYSHVEPLRQLQRGVGTGIAPNVSLRNGSRIAIGDFCHIGERSSLWAGDATGGISLGDRVSVAPSVFITASDYRFVSGVPFREQPKRERDVIVGSDVWLGTGVVVTAGVQIGDGCIVGAGAVVTKDLPPNSIAVGIPARVVGLRKCLNQPDDTSTNSSITCVESSEKAEGENVS